MGKQSSYGKATKKKTSPVAPTFFEKSDSLEGFEDISTQTMAIPFIRVLQTLSPQLNKKKPEFIEGAQEGMFFNSVTKEVYGPNVSVIVLKFERIFIEWLPDRGGLVNYHSPEHAEEIATDKSKFGSWKTKTGNLLQENYVYYIIIVGRETEGVAVLPLTSTGIKTAKGWNRLMTTHVMDNGRKALPFYLVWALETEYRENDQGNWYVPIVRIKNYITEKQYAIITPERKMLPSRQVDYAQLAAPESNEDEDKEVETAF